MELAIRQAKRHNLYVRTYPGEYAKIIKENFGIVYEPGLIRAYNLRRSERKRALRKLCAH